MLREDFARIPELLALDPPAQPGAPEPEPEPVVAPVTDDLVPAGQLGLF